MLAARLAANPAVKVLLLEAGGTDDSDLVMGPNRWVFALGSNLDWGFQAEAHPRLNGRAIPYSMGKVLGGGSSINVSTWSRGHKDDWDFYAAEAGDPSWGYDAVLDLYRHCIEDWAGYPNPDYRETPANLAITSMDAPAKPSRNKLSRAASTMARSFSAIIALFEVFAAAFFMGHQPSTKNKQFPVNLQQSFPHHKEKTVVLRRPTPQKQEKR